MSENNSRAKQTLKDKRISSDQQNAHQDNSFGLWRYNLKYLIAKPRDLPPEDLPENTDICVSIVAVCLCNLERNMRWAGLELSSRHYCWSDMKNRDPASISEAVSFQLRQSLVAFVHERIITLSDPSPNRILQSFESIRNSHPSSRCLFIFNGHGTPDPITDTCIFLSSDEGTAELKISDLVESMPLPGCFVFDCDFAGSIYKSFVDSNGNSDRFAFFSCGPDECLPHRLGLPSDLFTSCLLTPALVSMLWGSRQFYAFNSGGLHQFQLSYFSDENGIRPHLLSFSYEIERLLQCLTKAMAYESTNSDELFNLFYRDMKVGKLFVNFCLARRIGSEIGFTPMSYPEMPDFSRHQLWEFFDLYLDRVILRLTQMDSAKSVNRSQIAGDMTNFLSDALIAIEHSLKLQLCDSFPSETALMPMILAENELALRGITALTKFIDTGDRALRTGLCYGLLPILLKMPFGAEPQLLLPIAYTVAKFLCFSLHDKSLFAFTCSGSSIAFHLLSYCRHDQPLYTILALIIITCGLKLDPEEEAKNVPPSVFPCILKCLSMTQQLVAFWCLLFISEYLSRLPNFVPEYAQLPIAQSLLIAMDSPSSEVRAAFIAAFSSLISFESSILERYNSLFSQILFAFQEEPSHLVRMEEIFLIMRFLTVAGEAIKGEKFGEASEAVTSSLKILATDPHPEIYSKANSLLEKFSKNETLDQTTMSTTLLIASLDSFLIVKYDKLNHYIATPFGDLSKLSVRQPHAIVFRKMNEVRFSEIDHINIEKPISRNFTFINCEKILYIVEDKILIRNYNDHSTETTLDLKKYFSKEAISHGIHVILPLTDDSLFIATKKGDVAIISKVLTPSAILADCFKFIPITSKPQSLPLFDYCTRQRIVYAVIDEGYITPWSLDMCSMLESINVCDDAITCMKAAPLSDNIIAIGTKTDFQFIDITDSEQPQVLMRIEGTPLVFKPILSQNDTFAIIFADGQIKTAETRNQQSPKTVAVQIGAMYLDTTEWDNVILVGGQTLTLVDTQSGKVYNILESLYLKRQQTGQITGVILHHKKQTLSFVVNSTSVHTVGIFTA